MFFQANSDEKTKIKNVISKISSTVSK